MHQVTIKDIAKALGISASTVSRALKDHPDISEHTKNLVQDYAEKVRYRPNALALNLRRSKTNTIGIIIPEMVHHFFSSVISGVDKVAYATGYNVMICQSNEEYHREVIDAQALLDNRVDGILMSLSKTTYQFDHIRNLMNHGIPVVFFDRAPEGLNIDKVLIDDFVGAKIATNHLINIGCKKIVHLSGPQNLLIGQKRREGYLKALEENGIRHNPKYIIHADTMDDVFAKASELLALADEVDAIFAVNDSSAIAAMQILLNNGYKIPDDISVVGFGDGPNAKVAYPPLTTIVQKGTEMGQEAVTQLINLIENEELVHEPKNIVLNPVLVIRESTRKI